MKKHGFRSFRRQLNTAFLAVSLIPLLLCSVLLVQIFRLRISADTQQAAQQQLSAASAALENVHIHLEQTAEALREDPLVVQALFREEAEDSKVYASHCHHSAAPNSSSDRFLFRNDRSYPREFRAYCTNCVHLP